MTPRITQEMYTEALQRAHAARAELSAHAWSWLFSRRAR